MIFASNSELRLVLCPPRFDEYDPSRWVPRLPVNLALTKYYEEIADMHHVIVKRVVVALIILLIVAVVVFAIIVTPPLTA